MVSCNPRATRQLVFGVGQCLVLVVIRPWGASSPVGILVPIGGQQVAIASWQKRDNAHALILLDGLAVGKGRRSDAKVVIDHVVQA